MWRFWQKRGHLAEARRRLDAMAAAPWSHDDPRLRAKLMEALGGTCWWQGEIGPMGVCYAEALELWLSIGDEAEIANAYYNASFQYAVPEEADPARTADPEWKGLALPRARPRPVPQARRRARAKRTRCGGSATIDISGGSRATASTSSGGPLKMFQESGDTTMEAWSQHMLGSGLLRNGDVVEAHERIELAVRHFHAAGDAAGRAISLDDLSAVAVAEGDLPRAARLRGAARNLTVATGAALAGYVEDTFETGVRPGVRSVMSEEDLARYGAEGAAMTLDEAVAYALAPDDTLAARRGVAGHDSAG